MISLQGIDGVSLIMAQIWSDLSFSGEGVKNMIIVVFSGDCDTLILILATGCEFNGFDKDLGSD